MPLAGYQPEQREISLANGSFHVRGLSLPDVAVLMREHFPDLEAVFDLFQGSEKMQPEQWEGLALSVISNAPGFAANVIALAAGEGSAEDAARLPAPVQLKTLMEIGHLTFVDVGGPGKAWEIVAGLLKNKAAMQAVKKVQDTRAG
jgi:hypothetical protein